MANDNVVDISSSSRTLSPLTTPRRERATPEEIRPAIDALAKLTRHPPSQQTDPKLLASAFVKYLSDYPIDVIRGACDEWVRTKVFFPAIAELREVCDRRMPPPPPQPNPLLLEPPRRDWDGLPPEKKAEINRLLEETKENLTVPERRRKPTPARHVPLSDEDREALLDKLTGGS